MGACFVMVWIGKSERREELRTHIVETASRIYGEPEFFYYALADGVQKLFTPLREVERETRLEEGAAETVTATRNCIC